MWIVASCVLAVPVLLVVLAQAILPTLAAHRLRGRVARYGTVYSVSVKAFPAIELLWGKADSVEVRAGALSVPSKEIAKLHVGSPWRDRSHDERSGGDFDRDPGSRERDHGERLAHRKARLGDRGERDADPAAARRSATQRVSHRTAQRRRSGEAQASGGLFGLQASITRVVRPLKDGW